MLSKIATGVQKFFDVDFGRTNSWQINFRKLGVCRS